MAKGDVALVDDPRWLPFCELYQFDLARFAMDVVGMVVTPQQFELFDSVSEPGSRTSVASGHGTGKSRSLGVIAWWHLVCYFKSNFLITAPKIEQVRNVAWKEIADIKDLIASGIHGWIADYVMIEAERVYIRGYKESWFVIAKTAPKGSPENLAGMHRDWLMIWADEASGVPDANYSVLTGALTDARNRMGLTSQPTRDSGFFYDTHHKLSKDNGGAWNSIVMNSEESPLVSLDFIKEKLIEYGGRDSVEYQIRVRGMFPEHNDKYLLGRKAVEACFDADQIILPGEMYGYLLLVDVAAGEYRDKSVATLVKVIGDSDYGDDARRVEVIDVPVFTNTRNIEDFTGEIFRIATETSNCTVLVDAGGMGVAVCQKLETLGLPDVRRIKWGNPCFKKRYKERFFNQRAQATVLCAKAVKDGRLTLPDKYRKDFLDQASRIPYHFDEKARYVVESKEVMRSDGIPSPDLWDTVCFAFLEDAVYTIAEGVYTRIGIDRKAQAEAKAEEAFADIT